MILTPFQRSEIAAAASLLHAEARDDFRNDVLFALARARRPLATDRDVTHAIQFVLGKVPVELIRQTNADAKEIRR
jgi:hypothetical protein